MEQNCPKRCAWVTLICNDEYLPGVLALSRSLQRSKTKYPLIVMIVEETLSKEAITEMEKEDCLIKSVQSFAPKQELSSLAFKHFIFCWTKLRAFQFDDILDRCVFLDCDIIVLKNCDELFQLEDQPNFAAVQTCICNPMKTSTYPTHWNPTNCPHTFHEQSSNNSESVDQRTQMFNAGVFLFHPNTKVFERMCQCLDEWDLNQFQFAEQDFLNRFYQDQWKHLPPIYNSLKTFSVTHPNLWDVSKIKIIHFILDKPWNQSNHVYEHINQLWWDAFHCKSAS